MINNINKNSYNMNPYIKLPTKPNNEEILTQSKVEDIDVKDFFLKIKEELKNVELIAIKMIKGEPLTPKEQRLITEKYPDIKQLAQQSKKEIKDLKEQIKNCKTEKERQQVISKAIENIKVIDKKGLLSKVEVKIKMSVLEEVEKFSQKINLEDKKSEIIATKIIKGEKLTPNEQKFITEKYTEIKQLAEQSLKESKDLKEQIKNCKTEKEKQQATSKAIDNLEEMFKKGIISPMQLKFKMLAIESIKNEKENNKLFNINPYVYLNPGALVDNLTGILMVVVIIIIFLYMI